jgi:hypothetical protein
MEIKKCSKCKEDKILFEFIKDKSKKDGLSNICKECKKIENHRYRLSDSKKYKQQQKKYRNSNKEKESIRNKKWLDENKQKRTEYCINYEKNRKKIDPTFKVLRNVRVRLNLFLKTKNLIKPEQTMSLVGCRLEALIEHLESKFLYGMSWENYGKDGWHIDHKIPLSSAKTDREIYELCHHTNLQPLWAKDNLKKSNKIIF